MRKVIQEFISFNILQTTIEHNGLQGGDAGHGGYVAITFKNEASTCMELNGEIVEEFTFTFKGDSERETLIDSLEMILEELLKTDTQKNNI